jgi:protein-L-isoaspartate O-methyltransferase
MADPDADARRIAHESLVAGDPVGWFERLYLAHEGGEAVVPWDRDAPHPLLVEWLRHKDFDGAGRRAVVIGAGLGEDAELVARAGFDTVAFDIAGTAIRTARKRFPDSTVDYVVADLLDPPAEWHQAFDLVVESLTVQSIPRTLRGRATAGVGRLVAPGGTLLVHAGAQRDDDLDSGPPWLLTRAEIEAFATGGLRVVRIEDLEGEFRRWRAEFHRPVA